MYSRALKISVLVLFYLASFVIGVLIAFLSTPICLQIECVQKSTFILGKADFTVDPCKDFYKYMCGMERQEATNISLLMVNKNVSNDPQQTESVFKYMARKVGNYNAATRMGTVTTKNPLYHERLLAMFFTMCDKVSQHFDAASNSDVRNRLNTAMQQTGMSARDLLNVNKFNKSFSAGAYEYRSRIVGFPGSHLFSCFLRREKYNYSNFWLYVGRPRMPVIPHAEMVQVGQATVESLCNALLQYFIKSITQAEMTPAILKESIKLWFEVYDLINVTENQKEKTAPVKTTKIQKDFPDLDFLGILERCGAAPHNKEYVYVLGSAYNYFKELKDTMKKYSRQAKVVFLLIMNVVDVAPFLSFPTEVASLIQNFASLSSPGSSCKSNLGNRFGGMALSLVIQRFRLELNPTEILIHVFPDYVEAMSEWLDRSEWMDEKTKSNAKEKLQAMRHLISIPKKEFDSIRTPGKRAKYYSGLCFQRSVLQTVLCMNKFFARKNFGLFVRGATGFDVADDIPMGDIMYNQQDNAFLVPIFLLRFPAFDHFWPKHVNFGGIGVEIGAQLTTGFDLTGSQYDKYGLTQEWYSKKTMEKYKEKELSCTTNMKPAVGKALKTQITSSNIKTMDVNDLLKFGELSKAYWTEILGVKLSMEVYKVFKKKMTYRQKKLPGLEQFSDVKNFFLAHAHMRCLPPEPVEDLKTNQTLYFRAISELREFRDAFGCDKDKGDKAQMAVKRASKSCLLW